MNAQQKLEKIKQEGLHNLVILSDFDQTLTASKKENTPFAQIRNSSAVSQKYKEEVGKVRDSYIAKEKELADLQKRKNLFRQWSEEAYERIINQKLSKEQIKTAITEQPLVFREQHEELFTFTDEKNIPLVILSGSPSVCIHENLIHNNLANKNIIIPCNHFTFDEDERINGILPPQIYVGNKDKITLTKEEQEKVQIKKRKNAILLGDDPLDSEIAGAFKEFETIYSIGFSRADDEALLRRYEETYDEVIDGNTSFEFLNKLLKEMKD